MNQMTQEFVIEKIDLINDNFNYLSGMKFDNWVDLLYHIKYHGFFNSLAVYKVSEYKYENNRKILTHKYDIRKFNNEIQITVRYDNKRPRMTKPSIGQLRMVFDYE